MLIYIDRWSYSFEVMPFVEEKEVDRIDWIRCNSEAIF